MGIHPPGFTLVSSKKRSSKAAKLAARKGRAEGQSSGKVKSLSPRSSSEGPLSRPENSGMTSGTGSSGKVARSLVGPLVGLAGLAVPSASSMGPAGSSAEGQPSLSADSGRISEENMLTVGKNECHKCKVLVIIHRNA